LISVLISVFACNLIFAEEELDIKKAFRFGFEIGNYSKSKSDSYYINPGFSLGYMTGVNLHTTQGTYVLGIDLGYTTIINYKKQHYYYRDGYRYEDIYDQRHQFSFIEAGIFPEYLFPIGWGIIGSVYAGGSVGIGQTYMEQKQLSHTIIDSTYITPYGWEEGDEGRPYTTIGNLNIGTSLYYKKMMIDLRYKYSTVSGAEEYHSFYIQIGYVLK
jgi:hypothetical protein